ncbi:MAG: type II toxin-antitoxin system death-on-curing family toxin [Planctomycetota bacterium]|nr:MAG: type II toxin-antitoxin system death-on-curing family toxin [Planctomycetota bacterium]
MDDPVWLEEAVVLALHSDQIQAFGGLGGIRDYGLLASALARPRYLWALGNPRPDIVALAASLTFGLARNHPFVDGNKRIALIACHTFLQLNGKRLVADQQSQVDAILRLAAGEMGEIELLDWLRPRVQELA